MARPTIEGRYNFDVQPERQRFDRDTARLSGPCEVTIKPVRNLRSNAQNRYWHGVVCRYLADYLSDQDYEVTTVADAHRILAFKFLTVDVINPKTGEVIAQRVRSTAELDTKEFTDLIDRSRAYLLDFFGIRTPDPNQYGVPANAA